MPLVLMGIVLLTAVLWVGVIMSMLVGLDRTNRDHQTAVIYAPTNAAENVAAMVPHGEDAPKIAPLGSVVDGIKPNRGLRTLASPF
ncbi:hypothetical protein [Paenarthrobacter histidinolovorans]|uniref:hypothetical protein n=1 Tax=Paenarthrobacter histidinolovorans TaxID=43664 RepID=UPI00166CB1B7|nr:hypothetical protein [Paenarthrobacter histidinolovorans]